MILSNTEIVNCLRHKHFTIEPCPQLEAHQAPFNTSAIDLHLSPEIVIPDKNKPFQIDLRSGSIADLWKSNCRAVEISDRQPYSLDANEFILARTEERVGFPIQPKGKTSYAARVEGRSSLARCGVLIHFTAPTIHAGFEGTITLEIINLGPAKFLLFPKMPVCQIIIEEVKGSPIGTLNQFKGQSRAVGR